MQIRSRLEFVQNRFGFFKTQQQGPEETLVTITLTKDQRTCVNLLPVGDSVKYLLVERSAGKFALEAWPSVPYPEAGGAPSLRGLKFTRESDTESPERRGRLVLTFVTREVRVRND